MDYTNLFSAAGDRVSRIGVIGATRGYGYTLLAQIPSTQRLKLRAVCSRHPEECLAVLEEIGYDMEQVWVCQGPEDIAQAPEEAILVVSDYRLVMETGVTGIVECTGNVSVSCRAAMMALERGINVYMVSKETDCVCGPMFHQIAKEHGAVYALVNGDQPRNLVDLISWARVLGLEVIAAGKSSEYDFVWDRETGILTYTNGTGAQEHMPQLIDCWRYEGAQTLEKRRELLRAYTDVISADLCEMNLVSNVTGLVPAGPFLSYPIAKPSELADIFIPEEDGGILKQTGVVDVFFNLREAGEASFAGGEFIVVRCTNSKMWDMLRGKGHVVSKSGKYACIYRPYHLMGLESPITILLGDLLGLGTRTDCRQVSILSGVAREDLPQGTTFQVVGHNHKIECLLPELLERRQAGDLAPYYLLSGASLRRPVKKGAPITLEDVELPNAELYDLYTRGLTLG